MKIFKYSSCFLLATILVGCNSRIDAVNEQMAIIRSEAPTAIEPAPVFESVPTYSYSAQQLRSPFLPSSLAEELKVMSGKRVYPNLSRPEQELEKYELESLKFKGSLKKPKAKILALIQTPDGEIERVQLGSYMGMNKGRVVSISPTRIDLLEVVPDGREGYIERPRSLVLLGPAD